MKKLVGLFLLGLFAVIGLSLTSYAADEDLIELFPYNQQACLEGTNECTQYKLGDSNWDFVYYGHRYNVVRGGARYASLFVDGNANGTIEPIELAPLAWNAFAALTINDSDAAVTLTSTGNRTDITTTFHAKYAYFDETGQLQMFEDMISTYYIFNDGSDATPANADWRLATQAEITAYDAADPKPATTRLVQIRMALDDSDSDGYVIEPIGFTKWTNGDVDTTTDLDVENWSTIITGNPNFVNIPAGWTVVSFGTNDRGTANPATTAYILTLPLAMIDNTVEPFYTEYTDQPAVFAGITALDDDLVTPGTNIVIDYNGTFDLPTTVTASWLNMFDEEGLIINATDKLDYSVTISQDGTDLETIDFTYDLGTDAYTASGPVTEIDTSVFGSGYTATWSVTNPASLDTVATADIVIGVMPPKYAGVTNKYVDAGVYVDLLQGVTADDGYSNDVTDSIEVTVPEGFNMYNPFPGTYQIDLSFTHHVFIAGVHPEVTLNGTAYTYYAIDDAAATGTNSYNLHLYTDVSIVKSWASLSWTSAVAVIGADGKVDQVINRQNNKVSNEANPLSTLDAGNTNVVDPAAWLTALTLEEGGFIVVVKGTTSIPENAVVKGLAYDTPVSYVLEVADFNYDIVTESSYMLTVDDMTAPILLVVNDDYTIEMDQFATVNKAILSNVVAFDMTDDYEDLAIFVSNPGGMSLTVAGTYTVEVTVEDLFGNTAVQTFDITVVAPKVTETDVQDMIDAIDLLTEAEVQALIDALDAFSEAEVQALIDAQTLTEAEIQALIDASIPVVEPDTGCGSAISSGSVIFFVLSATAMASTIFIARNKKETSK